MTLLRDIQEDATGTEVAVTTWLQKALIHTTGIDHAPLRQWASDELDRGEDREPIP